MPTLVEKVDGTHCIRHHYRQNSTWQIDGDGVLFLRSLGVSTDKLFSTDLFMIAWSLGYLYTSSKPRIGPPKRLVTDEQLHETAKSTYQAIFARRLEPVVNASWITVRGGVPPSVLLRRLKGKALGVVKSWKILNVYSSPITDAEPGGPTNFGLIYSDWQIAHGQATTALKGNADVWLKADSNWYWIDCGWTSGMLAMTLKE